MTVRYHLVLLHRAGRQDRSDFETIRSNMAVRAPDIEVFILSRGERPSPDFWRNASRRPSVIFSPQAIPMPPPFIRGTRLISIGLNKLEEMEVLRKAGAAVPEAVVIEPHTRLDEARWGALTVIKPIQGKRGRGISLMRTKDVRWTDTTALPADHPRYGQKLLAMRFINTGPFSRSTRVMMVAGRPVYSVTSQAIAEQVDLLSSDAFEVDIAANGVERTVKLNYDQETINFARAIHANLPHLPSMGVDIIREQDTGKLYALEYNSKGGIWHISSDFGKEQQRKYGNDYKAQFNALDTITDALIEVTRRRAV